MESSIFEFLTFDCTKIKAKKPKAKKCVVVVSLAELYWPKRTKAEIGERDDEKEMKINDLN